MPRRQPSYTVAEVVLLPVLLGSGIATGGTSTLREAVAHAGIEQAAQRIFDAIGWHGLAMSEWKVCPHTGQFWFVEVNPRMWGSIALPISVGVEFPYLAWLCAAEGEEAARAYQEKAVVRPSLRRYRGDVLPLIRPELAALMRERSAAGQQVRVVTASAEPAVREAQVERIRARDPEAEIVRVG